jgi:hypothetical protein
MWHPTVPNPPVGFPYELPGGLELTETEARWLRDRIMAGASRSLLAHLLGHGGRPVEDSNAPWEDPVVAAAPNQPAALLKHAELFSVAIYGAALLYNLLIAERYETAGLTQVEHPVEDYRAQLSWWTDEVEQRAGDFAVWDREDMWRRLTPINPRIASNVMMRQFVDTWLNSVRSGAARVAADDPRLRAVVGQREKLVKQAQSRLVNERMLRAWSGASGTGRLTFRWTNVRRLVTDIHDSLDVGTSDASA